MGWRVELSLTVEHSDGPSSWARLAREVRRMTPPNVLLLLLVLVLVGVVLLLFGVDLSA